MFYHFEQNNSGGHFYTDHKAGMSHHVIIEASSIEQAFSKAEDIGLYFNGCDDGRDCNCCGDRWSKYGLDVTETPTVYNQQVEPGEVYTHGAGYFNIKWIQGPEGYIHYLDGRIESFWAQ